MGRTWRAAFSILFLITLLACNGGSDVSGPASDDITGTWQATRVLYTGLSKSGSLELISAGGTATLVLNADGTLLFTVSPPGGPEEMTTGRWDLDGDVMTVTPSGMPFSWEFDVSFSGNELRLSGAHVAFDIDGDDRDEETVLEMVLVR